MMTLTISSDRSQQPAGPTVTVAVSGEIDLATVGDLERGVTTALDELTDVPAAGPCSVRVDLSEVSFIDSAGISALLKGRRAADDHHRSYRVVGATGFVLQVLEMTGVWAHLSGPAD
jgi:anti-sigma B factor antagonist